jgi:putative hemolysin
MTRAIDITSIHSTATDEEILKVLRESAYSRFPVYNEDINDIVGILYAKDFYIDRLRDGKDTPLLELLRTASFVPETVKCDKLFFEMQKNNRHIALVVDEYGAVSGLVTLEDLLEEIVGNIYDEYDEEEKEEEEKDITLLEDNLWRVAGFTEIEELAEVVGFTLPEDREYDTLGGMVMSELSQIPDDGDQSIEVECCGIHIKVEKIEERRIEWALVSKLDTTDDVDGEEEKND